jgi:hypothetical protein
MAYKKQITLKEHEKREKKKQFYKAYKEMQDTGEHPDVGEDLYTWQKRKKKK